MHQSLGNIPGRGFKIAFGIDADDWLRIGSAQVDPVIVKFDLQAIIRICRMVLVFRSDLRKYLRHIYPFLQFDLVLGNKIIRVTLPE